MKLLQVSLPFEYYGEICFVYPTRKELSREVKVMVEEVAKNEPYLLRECVRDGSVEIPVTRLSVTRITPQSLCKIINSRGGCFVTGREASTPIHIPVNLPEED